MDGKYFCKTCFELLCFPSGTVAELSRDASLLKISAGNGHGDAVAGVYEYEIDPLQSVRLDFQSNSSVPAQTLTVEHCK